MNELKISVFFPPPRFLSTMKDTKSETSIPKYAPTMESVDSAFLPPTSHR